MRWFPEPVSATNKRVAALAMAAVTFRMLFSTVPGGVAAELVEAGGVVEGSMVEAGDVVGLAARPSSEARLMPSFRAQQQLPAVHLL